MSEGSGARRWLLLGMGLGLVVVVAAAAVVVFVVLDGEDGKPVPAPAPKSRPAPVPTGDPGDLPPPEGDVARQTLDYLAGAGAPALTMHRAATELGANPTADQCDQAGTALDRDAPHDQLVEVIQGVLDPALQELLGVEQASLGLLITACLQGQQPTDEVLALPEAVQLVQRRLDQLEAAR
jgi:hypothetical protein